MRMVFRYVLLIVTVSILGQGLLWAQACKDEQGMVENYQKDLVDTISTVKKENQGDFEKKYHQKCVLTNLTLFSSMVDEAVSCLDKAATDPAATKEDVAAYKTKHDSLAKVEAEVNEDAKALKAETDPKKAKALIEKIEFAN